MEEFRYLFFNESKTDQDLLLELLAYLTTNPSSFINVHKILRTKCLSQKKILHLFETLEENKIGKRVNAFTHPEWKIDLVPHFKFYFYDTQLFFKSHEHFLRDDQDGAFLEQLFFSKIIQANHEIYHFRTTGHEAIEVDFILKIHENLFYGIEIKKDQFIYAGDLKGLHFFDQHFFIKKELFVLHSGTRDTKEGIINVIPMEKGIFHILNAPK